MGKLQWKTPVESCNGRNAIIMIAPEWEPNDLPLWRFPFILAGRQWLGLAAEQQSSRGAVL